MEGPILAPSCGVEQVVVVQRQDSRQDAGAKPSKLLCEESRRENNGLGQ